MKILLINPPDNLELFIGKGSNFVPSYEPLGLLYIAAVCRNAGYDVQVVDAVAQRLSLDEVKGKIAALQPDVVGFTSFVCSGACIYTLGQWVKKEYPGMLTVFGNIHATVYAESYLRNNCCDIVVHGEGEEVFLSILRAKEHKGGDYSDILAISYMHNGRFTAHRETAFVEDITQLPFPDRDAVDQKLYCMPSVSNGPYVKRKHGIGKHMFTARGCLFSCRFCTVHNTKGLRLNSVARALEEMELLVTKYSAGYLFFADPIFTSRKERVIAICDEIKRRGLRFHWGCEGHVNMIDQEMAEAMESAGCHDIAFGVESGVQRILDGVRKGTQLKKIEDTITMVKKKTNILVSGLFILGLPGEEPRDTLQTIAFAKKLPLDMAQFSILSPYPGSPLFFDLRQQGVLDTGERADGSLDTSVWLRYSAYVSFTKNTPIWVTQGLTPGELVALQKRAVREFYLRPRQIFFQLRRMYASDLWRMLLTAKDAFF